MWNMLISCMLVQDPHFSTTFNFFTDLYTLKDNRYSVQLLIETLYSGWLRALGKIPKLVRLYLDAAASATARAAVASSTFFLFFSSLSCFSATDRASCSDFRRFSSWVMVCLSFCLDCTALWSLMQTQSTINASKCWCFDTDLKSIRPDFNPMNPGLF